MKLRPDLLGIGVPRAGTTWLHSLLASHPDVAMPTRQKELSFFTRHYHRGEDWYAASYGQPTTPPVRVGEITPMYLYHDEVRTRIREFGGIEQFVVCLREPVQRMWSDFTYHSAVNGYRGSIDEFIDERPDVVANGFYARYLEPWLDEFGEKQFLLIRFDTIRDEPSSVSAALAEFLDLDEGAFTHDQELRRNAVVSPRFPGLYTFAKKTAVRLHQSNASWAVNLVKRLRLDRRIATQARSEAPEQSLPAAARERLLEIYADDQQQLATLTGITFPPPDSTPIPPGPPR